MNPSNSGFGIDAYQELWAETIASVMSQFAGANLMFQPPTPAGSFPQASRSVTFTLGDPLAGEQSFSVALSDALLLSQSFMGEPHDPAAAFSADHEDAFAELFRQFAGTMATRLKSVLGSECSVQFRDAKPLEDAGTQKASFVLSTEPAVTLFMQMDKGLISSLEKKASQAAEIQQLAEPAEGAPPTGNNQVASREKNLDLLLDVDLQVSLRFGRRNMLLRDVLELASGAMVELDRRVQDPVELVLGGRVIARGEAVIVDGNYGIRISEVLSPTQRLAELS